MHFENSLQQRVEQQRAALIEGLHSLAQPLTSVQGTLELAVLGAESVDDYRKSVEAALSELVRVGRRFNVVRQLATAMATSEGSWSSEIQAKESMELS
jgi:hypothetical protein